MSDPKRATLITVGATKGEKNNVNKTVRLTINLDESNERKFPELNYKELVIAEVRKKVAQQNVAQQNGKTAGLNPFSDNDDDVERVAKKFEQKYGGKSTYGKKSKHDDFADIGAGYDENDSFIDNTDGYDEMIPPECETLYGGFYINCGLLEFKNAENAAALSDAEVGAGKRNKRRISSSSSEESSDSSSSESTGEKDPKVVANGAVDSHKTEHRKKKNKIDKKKKPKKIRRTESAVTSGKQTSDEAHADGESADSRTSQSDSLTSKPAPSSENPITSDSSRDVEHKAEAKLPTSVAAAVEDLEAAGRQLVENKDSAAISEKYVLRIERALSSCGADNNTRRTAWSRAAKALKMSRTKLLQRARALDDKHHAAHASNSLPATASSTQATTKHTTHTDSSVKRKADDISPDDVSRMTDEQREAKIVETLQRLKALIEERKPGMMDSYNAECERVQEERKKLQIASAAEGAPMVEKRLPKRRFPWCARSRALLSRLRVLAGTQEAAAALLAKRALPLFPSGFVRMPTLLRQADLNKEIKVDMLKRQRMNSSSLPVPAVQTSKSDDIQFMEPIHFPSSLTVTTVNNSDTPEVNDKTKNLVSPFGNIVNSFTISKDLVVENQERKELNEKKDDTYIPANNIGSITITPVSSQKVDEKNVCNSSMEKQKEPLLRVKSPAALNEMVRKKEKERALDIIHKKEKDKALENIHKKEKEKALENTHKKEKDKALEYTNQNQKEKALENIHKKEKEKALESIHKKEKDKALEIIHKKDKDKHKKQDKQITSIKSVEKRVDAPLHIDTSYQPKQKTPTPSPKSKEGIPMKQIESMRVSENNIPRPALIPVHHSPTFAKPDKRPLEVKKKKDIVIVSDMDPLADVQIEAVAIDDSSSDVEVIEDGKSDKTSDSHSVVPSDKVRDSKKVERHKDRSDKKSDDDAGSMNDDFNSLMRNLKDLENSQEQKITNSFGGVVTNAKNEVSSKPCAASSGLTDKDKLAERASLNKMDGCKAKAVTGNG